MKGPLPPDQALEHYRKGYLKMKTVLFDRATGLPAFPMLFDRLRTLLDQRRELGVIHLEIANLDMVESLYGWQVFDGIVARTAALLRRCLGRQLPQGALLALNGVAGERFVIFVPDRADGTPADAAHLADLARDVCAELEQGFDDDEFAGLSPGLCFRAGQAMLSVNPFFRFERCVYAAVDQARASYDRRERRRELSWSERLHKIVRNRAVRTVFQPVVELETGHVVGHEALARGPKDTIFEAPRTMFELSERVGLAADLDRLCFESALAASSELVERERVFVNVLQDALEDDAWREERLPALLEGCGLQAGDLVLEVSERGAAADPEPFVKHLCRFKEQGYRLALDDVGTGRPGANAVERVQPDFLKLDTSLVRDLHLSPIQQDVLIALSRLAGEIGAAVIAEGVESEAEARALADGGARYAQGHLFAVPAAARTLRAVHGNEGV